MQQKISFNGENYFNFYMSGKAGFRVRVGAKFPNQFSIVSEEFFWQDVYKSFQFFCSFMNAYKSWNLYYHRAKSIKLWHKIIIDYRWFSIFQCPVIDIRVFESEEEI